MTVLEVSARRRHRYRMVRHTDWEVFWALMIGVTLTWPH